MKEIEVIGALDSLIEEGLLDEKVVLISTTGAEGGIVSLVSTVGLTEALDLAISAAAQIEMMLEDEEGKNGNLH